MYVDHFNLHVPGLIRWWRPLICRRLCCLSVLEHCFSLQVQFMVRNCTDLWLNGQSVLSWTLVSWCVTTIAVYIKASISGTAQICALGMEAMVSTLLTIVSMSPDWTNYNKSIPWVRFVCLYIFYDRHPFVLHIQYRHMHSLKYRCWKWSEIPSPYCTACI